MPLFLHPGWPLAPHDLAGAWSLDAGIVLSLAAAAALYACGLSRLWQHAGAGHGVSTWEARAFCAGWLMLVMALVSPLHALGEVLFSAHMAQHELLIALVAPLLILGRPLLVVLWALPAGWRRSASAWTRWRVVRNGWRAFTLPAVAWLLHAAAVWAWHVPRLYDAALTSQALHALQHASFLATGLLFWWALVHGREVRMGYGPSIVYVFTTALHTGGLGALLTFAPAPWCTAYEGTTAAWGLTRLEDQQLAGLIMWIPGSMTYLAAALVLVAAWLREAERRVGRWQHWPALTAGE